MKISKDGKKGFKALFAVVLVMTLLVTMLPFENMGTIAAKAEETSALKTGLLASAPIVTVDSAEKFKLAINNETTDYSNGLIIVLKDDIDFEHMSLSLPIYPLGIDMGSYSITGICDISFGYVNSLTMLEGYNGNLFVLGDGETSTFEFVSEGDIPVDWQIGNQEQVVFSGVNLKNVNITANPGSAFGYNDFYYEVPTMETDTSPQWYVYYYADEGLYRSKTDYSTDYPSVTAYVEELFFPEDYKGPFDVQRSSVQISGSGDDIIVPNKYVYSQKAVDSMPDNVNLLFSNGWFQAEYTNPGVAFTADSQYGLYSTSEDGKTMTVYSIYSSGIAMFKTLEQTNTTQMVALDIYTDYYTTIEKDGQEEEVACENVIFAASALPGENDPSNYWVKEVFICGTSYYINNKTHFQFDGSNNTGLIVYNEPMCTKASFSVGGEQNEVWVGIQDESMGVEGREEVEESTNVTRSYRDQQTTFIKTGSVYTVKLTTGYTVSNIMFGGWQSDGEGGYAYDYGYRTEADNIIVYPNGKIEFTVPNYTTNLSFVTAPISELSIVPEFVYEALYIDENTDTYWHQEEFAVSVQDYQVCDVTENKDGVWSDAISENVEGTYQKQYYFVDKSLDDDGVSPSSTYGQIANLDYNYVLDIASPIITSVDAVDAAGNTMELEGDWYTKGAAIPDPVWTNQKSVTLTVNAEKGDGLDIVEYKFTESDNVVQTSNIYTCSGEGVHELLIHVYDEFDKSTNRVSGGVWLTTVGIDTVAPVLMFTDAKNTTSSELKSNSEYEGNLLVVCEDEGSGFAEINLYKKTGDKWVASNNLLIATEEGSYIAPTTQNETYKIEVVDVVGNKTVYENVTVIGYEQDVEVTVGDATGTYGEELQVPVTITNTSDNKVEIAIFTLREEATDDVFGKEIESVTELEAGRSFTTTLTIPKGTDAATYEAMIDMTYTSVGDSTETTINKVYSHLVTATIEKAAGTGSVTVENLYYGEIINPTVVSDTNGTKNVTYYYKEVTQDDSAYTTTVPTAVGIYVVKAVFASTINYKELAVVDEFTITRLQADANMYAVSKPTREDGVYEEPIVIRGLNGNLISTSETTAFTDRITLNDSTEFFRFFIKTPSGAITDPVILRDIVIETEVIPTPVAAGRAHLYSGEAYTFGEGTWNVSGDSTSYAGGITFYVSETGDYEFTQQTEEE